jgi:catechol 2,3-dioxygenase-like lactoylglutathione lyase family enzyme
MAVKFNPGEINIICTDLERSRKFYCDILGFEVIVREGNSALHLRCGERPFLLLAVAGSPSTTVPYCTVPAVSFDLNVADIEETVAYLRDHNVVFESDWQPGDSYVFIRDPDGLVIEIVEE